MAKRQPQLDLPYHRTIRARPRRALLHDLPPHDVSGLTPMRPESVTAARASRISTMPLPEALAKLVNHSSFHGQRLHQLCGDSHLAERAVLLAERVGWIKRGNYDPTPEQTCTLNRRLLQEEYRRPLQYHWMTVTTKWLEPDYVRQMLIGGGVL